MFQIYSVQHESPILSRELWPFSHTATCSDYCSVLGSTVRNFSHHCSVSRACFCCMKMELTTKVASMILSQLSGLQSRAVFATHWNQATALQTLLPCPEIHAVIWNKLLKKEFCTSTLVQKKLLPLLYCKLAAKPSFNLLNLVCIT